MAKKDKAAEDLFKEQLREALERFDDPEWLGAFSPFAAPYFLDAHLLSSQEAELPVERGNALRRVLLEAAVGMAEQRDNQRLAAEGFRTDLVGATAIGGTYRDIAAQRYRDHLREQLKAGDDKQRILYWRYFHQSKLSNDQLFQLMFPPEEWPLWDKKRSSFFRYINQAVQALSEALVRTVQPAVRVESPPRPQSLIGRNSVLKQCEVALSEGRIVTITGAGGVGKTALAAALVDRLRPRPAFWYTIRPGLNDYLGCLLFALSRFLQQHGSGTAWRELVANQDRIDEAKIANLVRYDLSVIHPQSPLLCFDEIDMLQPDTVEANARLLTFVQSLGDVEPELALVLVSQRLPLDIGGSRRFEQELTGLEPAAFHDVLARFASDTESAASGAPLQLDDDQLRRLHAYTGGNPRLLQLFGALFQRDEPIDELLTLMSRAPSIEGLLNRIWPRLNDGERIVLGELTAFRRAAPLDIWRDRTRDLDGLMRLNLAQPDTAGGVNLIPAIRDGIYRLISPEDRELIHSQAAAALQVRGEYTDTAYQYIQAGQAPTAIKLWYEHRLNEMNQGQGETALSLFSAVSLAQVQGQDQERLALIRGELQKRAGDYAGALRVLHLATWQTPLLKIRKQGLEGDIADNQDSFGQTVAAYGQGMRDIEAALLADNELDGRLYWHLPYRLEQVYLYRRLARIAMRQKDLDEAWQSVLHARYEVEDLQGQIREDQGRYQEAEALYLQALALATECSYTQGIAKSNNNLLRLRSFMGRSEDAFRHGDEAYRLFQRLGDTSNMASVRVNQALSYNLARQPGLALACAEEAWGLFSRLGEPWGMAVAAQNRAEAHLALGSLSEAKTAVEDVLRQEETATVPDALRTWGEILLREGDLPGAEQRITASCELAVQNQDLFLEAYAWRALAEVLYTAARHGEVADACGRAIALFETLDLPLEVAKTRDLCERLNGV